MLDQNTDRMWYVIGAVIIGAAIILIMNKTFPQLFASVGETFTGKVEQTTEVVDGILPESPNPNLLPDGEYGIPLVSNNTEIAPIIHANKGTYMTLTSPGPDKYVSTYSGIFLDIEEAGDYTTSAYVYSPVPIDLGIIKGETAFNSRPEQMIPAKKWVRVTMTDYYEVGEGRIWGFYSTKAIPEGIQYKQYKFEKGTNATPWVLYNKVL